MILLIRDLEEGAEDSCGRGQFCGRMNVTIGQKASAVGYSMSQADDDKIESTPRAHGHCLAKNACGGRMIADLFEKVTGYSRRRCDSMHTDEAEKAIPGAKGTVGGGLLAAAGSALRSKRSGTSSATDCYFGDGAKRKGARRESLELASNWQRPVDFVCKNKENEIWMPTDKSTAVKNISARMPVNKMPGTIFDGNDFSGVATAFDTAVMQARTGRRHSRTKCSRYRSGKEMGERMLGDPVRRMSEKIVAHGIMSGDEVNDMYERAARTIADAIEFTKSSSDSKVDEITRHANAGDSAA